jgi:hypothetical protein
MKGLWPLSRIDDYTAHVCEVPLGSRELIFVSVYSCYPFAWFMPLPRLKQLHLAVRLFLSQYTATQPCIRQALV